MTNMKNSILVSLLSFFIIISNIVPINAIYKNNKENQQNENNTTETVSDTEKYDTQSPTYEVESEQENSSEVLEDQNSTISPDQELANNNIINNNEVIENPTVEENGNVAQNTQNATLDSNVVYANGKIYIYNLKQLQAIGTNVPVKVTDNDESTFGLGEDIFNSGSPLTYSKDATYVLKNEISLNGECWNLPKDFKGTFISATTLSGDKLYDEETNTIYIYNSFQLDLVENSYNGKEAEPVLSNDYDVNGFGGGNLLYDANQEKICYDTTHNYVITTSFTEKRPLNENLQTQIGQNSQSGEKPFVQEKWGNADLAGRDYVGQVYKKIDGKIYILIGNKQQLAAIGSNKQVTPTLILRSYGILGISHKDTPLYPGDTDLNNDITLILDENKPEKFKYFEKNANPDLMDANFNSNLIDSITGLLGDILGGLLGENEVCGYNIDGSYIKEEALRKEYKVLKYSKDANYIIFRDIDLENIDWKPIMFSGTGIIGAKGDELGSAGSLWSNGIINENQITISNININQTNPIDVEKQSGIGFFGSIMSTSKKQIGLSDNQVVVKNIKLKNISVQNNANKIKDSTGLVSGLLGILGGIVGLIIPGNLGDALDALLNPDKHKDPTVFATGTFAGRVVGDVLIENCAVENITNISNVRDIVGGFVGHVEGMTEYGKLQETLGILVRVLEEVLNIIPLVDLGTLINVLLDGNIIDIDKLIPTGYKTPTINNCYVKQDNTLSIGRIDQISVGGFAGNMIGSIVKNSRITSNTLTVNGESFVGGFGGFVSNAEIVGLLSEIGLDLNVLHLNSFIIDSNINASNLSVSALGDYSGGMAGALANSFIVDSSINNEISNATVKISANNYVGGFAGIATVGQTIGLGEFQAGKDKLLKTVSKILSHAITNGKGTVLLSLIGVSPSVLAGCQLNGDLTVIANVTGGLNGGGDFAGGLVGRGDGVKIIPSSKLKEKSFIWKEIGDKLKPELSNNKTILNGIQSVSGNRYVGGLIGEATTASVSGILNQTIGVGNYLGFDIEDAELNFTQDSVVRATDECAGGLAGRAIGGTITNANVNSLKSVTADNMAGGFVGHGGTGSLAETGGLNILGLIKINNLISLADGVVLKINDSNVNGINSGLSVVASGENQSNTDVKKHNAGGFIGKSTSTHINNSHVYNLKNVEASMQSGYAGGFAGITETGGLAEAANNDTNALKLLGINGLLSAIPYLVSKFVNVSVSYIPDDMITQVKANRAGGFVGKMQSGYIINKDKESDPYAVYNIRNVEGEHYAGGFAGEIVAGGLASSNDLSILNGILSINLDNILGILNVYIPKIERAGVLSYDKLASEEDKLHKGLVVKSNSVDELDANSGSAGGYVGYASAAHISNSDVKQLRNTKVMAPSDLNSDDGSDYYGTNSHYAVSAKHYAGGYVGKLDIGNTASLGGGLNLLGVINLSDLTSALAVAASKLEFSDVYGAIGGYSVIANGTKNNNTIDVIGNAGGYAGAIYGSQLQNCDSYNFNYIIGKETAGGYVGAFEPGNVASVLGNDLNVLGGLLSSDNLLDVLQSFIPMIYNSETTSVPCGGAVRADGKASDGIARGLAGGYVGHNLGGRIEGNSSREWKGTKPTLLKENAVYRLRNVYGYEFSGGFSGRSECANVADTGAIKLLFGLIKVDNPLKAVQAVYFTETDTATYGPLRGLSVDEWNNWVKYVGINGSYGQQFQELGQVLDQNALDKIIEEYAYGYDIKAGRKEAGKLPTQGGVAGGYVGRMDGGVITSAHSHDLKLSTASRSSGGFAGEMMTSGVANVGGLTLAGIDITGSIPLLQTFVPVIKTSKSTGYKSGAIILANGTDIANKQGNAGGFVGLAVGGQIYGNEADFCEINKLKSVRGTNTVGGFAGSILTGSALNANVGSNDGLLPGLLGPILGKPIDLAKILNATISRVEYVKVDAWDNWGITIDGSYKLDNKPETNYAYATGGFVGSVSGSIIGNRKNNIDSAIANNIKSVIGGEHAGGFFGLADVAAIAQVGDNNAKPILGLIKLGELDVLDAFRPYVYHATVNGSSTNGLSVYANIEKEIGTLNSKLYTGNAGGFGGSILNGSIKDSSVNNLNQVNGLNYVGGFVGHTGRSGTVDLDKAGTGTILNGLLNATAGVMDNFGSHIDRSKVNGINKGYIIKSELGSESIAGGFAGYADLAKINDCNATELKKVSSDQIAGGFVGKTDFSYLADIDTGSASLLEPILKIVNALLDFLYVGELENLGAIEIDLGHLLKLDILSNGNTLSVTLLGLPISVALIKNNGNNTTDIAQIHIGDTYIEVPCVSTKGDHIIKNEKNIENIKIGVIKSNRTKIQNSSVSGIDIGYDVFGGDSSYENDGTHKLGMSGGFVGFNKEGLLQKNTMYFADTIKGTTNLVGPFTGNTSLDSNYHFNKIEFIEGPNTNKYHIYRHLDKFNHLFTNKGEIAIGDNSDGKWNRFEVTHINEVEKYPEFDHAYITDGNTRKDANVYISSSKAVLMDDAITSDNLDTSGPPPTDMQDPCDDLFNLTINKIWRDFNNIEKIRPNEITVTLTRSYIVNNQEVTDETFKQVVKITPSMHKNNWQYIVKNLPSYKVMDDGSHAFYKYYLTENHVEGYGTTIEYSKDGFTITITNTHVPLLPETGGVGILIFIEVGILGILIVLTSYLRRTKNEN